MSSTYYCLIFPEMNVERDVSIILILLQCKNYKCFRQIYAHMPLDIITDGGGTMIFKYMME